MFFWNVFGPKFLLEVSLMLLQGLMVPQHSAPKAEMNSSRTLILLEFCAECGERETRGKVRAL